MAAAPPRVRRIGPDRVVLQDERLLVVSPAHMEGWNVRQHRQSLIRFDGRTWRVASQSPGAGGANQYELVPWQPGAHELIGIEIDYDDEYVARRDRTTSVAHQRRRVTGIFRIVSPLVGFLPGRTKARLEIAFGVDPVATTFQSVFLEFLITLGSLAMSSIGQMIMAHEGHDAGISVKLWVSLGIMAGLDAAVRYDRILREQRPPPGFYEWLWTRRR